MAPSALSHFRTRKITRLGHEVRLMPPDYVKPHFKSGKTDASDAEAICAAVTLQRHANVALQTRVRLAESLADEKEAREERILGWHRPSDASCRLGSIPGIEPITASAITANAPDLRLARADTEGAFQRRQRLTDQDQQAGGLLHQPPSGLQCAPSSALPNKVNPARHG